MTRLDRVDQLAREQVQARLFFDVLARGLTDAIVAAGHWETWDMMRRNLGLSIDEARRAVEVMVHGAFALHGFDAEESVITEDALARLTERGRA